MGFYAMGRNEMVWEVWYIIGGEMLWPLPASFPPFSHDSNEDMMASTRETILDFEAEAVCLG